MTSWLVVWALCTMVGWLVRAARRPAVAARIPRLRAPSRLARALDDAGVTGDPDQVLTGWVAGLVAVSGAAALLYGAGAGVVAALGTIGLPLLGLGSAAGRALRAVDAALPELLDAVARSLRSGATLRTALGEAAAAVPGRLGADLGDVLAESDAGVPLAVALDRWPARCPTPGVRLAAAALALSAEAGGAPARAVDGVAATVRANQALAGEVRAQSSQAWFSALVIGLAPLAFTVVAAGTDGRTLDFLLGSPVGLACLAAGLLFDALALWWMRRLATVAA